MVQDGRWLAMTEQERAGIIQQATQGHLTPTLVGEMACAANVGSVLLTHLTHRPPPHTNDYTSWIDDVRKHFSGPVFVAQDLMEF
jgi:ribonuclease BN (tRNA processing enzyme)